MKAQVNVNRVSFTIQLPITQGLHASTAGRLFFYRLNIGIDIL